MSNLIKRNAVNHAYQTEITSLWQRVIKEVVADRNVVDQPVTIGNSKVDNGRVPTGGKEAVKPALD